MKPRTSKFLKGLSMISCIVPPTGATLYYFPVWYEQSRFEIVIPAAAVLSFCLCAAPLLKWISFKIKSPAMWMVWGIAFALFFLLEKIIDQMVIITLFGLAGNVIGAILWKVAGGGKA